MDFNKIKETVNSIEMSKSMSDRMKSNIQNKGQKRSQPFKTNKWRPMSSVFGILLLIIIGFSMLNQYGGNSNTDFVIKAYAENGISHNLLKEKVTFNLSTVDRQGVIKSIGGDGSNLIFTDILLHVSGENIDSIRYEINRGTFIEHIILTKDELNNKEQLLKDKINHIYSRSNSGIFQAIKEIGDSFTVKYSEQEQYQYSLAIPHHNTVEGDIIIKVTVTDIEGNSEQQNIIVNQESESITLELD